MMFTRDQIRSLYIWRSISQLSHSIIQRDMSLKNMILALIMIEF